MGGLPRGSLGGLPRGGLNGGLACGGLACGGFGRLLFGLGDLGRLSPRRRVFGGPLGAPRPYGLLLGVL